ncbi:hydrolase [Curvivirga aplysinae]|uniref:hydrolase n=1 Tax=Curvivirga aplysinae TaxID=2529852 RepID=UPI0012BD777B|nr:hydrolase [Curvivirga aplysinae]MTI11186.1 hydrolase [Curvivirga aplysinae]
MLLNVNSSSLLVVDVQEGLLPAVSEPRQVIDNTQILLQTACQLGVPVFVSEQYPKGLGHTAQSLDSFLNEAQAQVFEKINFSCYRENQIREVIGQQSQRKQLVICGMEAHVCVLQTAIEFQQAEYDVFLVTDAISSRMNENKKVACERMQQAGVTLVSTEMVAFEWMGKAGTDSFKSIAALIK